MTLFIRSATSADLPRIAELIGALTDKLLDARSMDEWTVFRVDGGAFDQLADTTAKAG
jgi:N-acetylglutamate synthase-like GNAT family acetyltransferase